MAEVINMPRLSDTMEEGTVATWLKQVGDKVEEGDILAEIETDKATMEFESFHEGTLLHIGVHEGETTKVDELLAIIGEEGEDISSLLNGGETASETPKATQEDDSTQDDSVTASAEIPEGVTVVTMPRLSDTMEEGTVATWLKHVGDEVEEGEILAEIETDKATMEFESFQSGTLLYVGLNEGDSAKVDSLLAIIGPARTDVSGIVANFGSEASAPAKAEATPAENTKTEAAPKEAVKVEATQTTTTTSGRLFISPLARKIAEEKGINLSQVTGSGENGRIVKRDIENFTPVAVAPTAAPVTESAPAPEAAPAKKAYVQPVVNGEESFEEVKNSQIRKVIAKRLTESKYSAPHYYLNVEFDMDNAIAARKQINALPDTRVSFNDMLIKACAFALRKHPKVNSQWFDDKIKLNHHVHIGVAVAIPDGLVVPVVKFANELSLQETANSVKDYAVRAIGNKLTPAEMSGSTFTISNLGKFGIESFTSIINQPNSAILSVGAIIQKPVVKNGEIVVGNTMKLTLACDHRTVDGATAAEFLQTLKQYVENPITMLA